MLNHSLSSLLHGCSFPSVFSCTLLRVTERIKKMHGYQRASLLAVVPGKRLAAIFNAAHRFQASNLRLLRASCNKIQLHDLLLPSSAFYRCSSWHFYMAPMLLGLPRPGMEKCLALERNFWKGEFGMCCLCHTPRSIACHAWHRSMRKHCRWAMHQAVRGLQHQAHSSLPSLSPNIPIPTEA